MNKLASHKYDILDYLLDGDLDKVAQVVAPLSKEAKESTVLGLEEISQKPIKEFGLVLEGGDFPELRKYAHYDAASTELSTAFLVDGIEVLPKEILKVAATNLKKASSLYKVAFPEQLEEFVQEDAFINPSVALSSLPDLSPAEPRQLEKIAYALPALERYPLNSKRNIMEANKYFDKYAYLMNPDEVVEYAKNVKEADASLASEVIEKFANLNTKGLNKDFGHFIDARVDFVSSLDDSINDSIKEEYLTLKKEARSLEPEEVFTQLSHLDKKANLYYYWGKGLAHPAETTFMPKTASTLVTLENLKSLDSSELTGLVGTSGVKDLKSDEGVDVFLALPTPIKKEIEALILKK